MGVGTWLGRHWGKLLLGGLVVAYVDFRFTNFVIERTDFAYEWAAEHDTPSEWIAYAEGSDEAKVEETARRELARHVVRAQYRLRAGAVDRPDGFDPLLAAALRRLSLKVPLEADALSIDRESFASVPVPDIPGVRMVEVPDDVGAPWRCASGLSEALSEALGEPLLQVDEDEPQTDDVPSLVLTWRGRASGELYKTGAGNRLFPGLVVQAQLSLQLHGESLASVDVTVDPGASVDYTTTYLAAGFEGDVDDVYVGMVAATCRRLGERLVDELVGRTPAADEAPKVDASKCEGGDAEACLLVAAGLQQSDPARAGELLERGCGSHSLGAADACLQAGELAANSGTGDVTDWARTKRLFENGCRQYSGEACRRAAEWTRRGARGEEPSELARREAYVLDVRGCGLGDGPACRAASEGPVSAAEADVLARHACDAGVREACDRSVSTPDAQVQGVALADGDRLFDVRWGMWFPQDATVVVWVASPASGDEVRRRLAPEVARGHVRVYAPDALPSGPIAPADAVSIYAVIPERQGLIVAGDHPCPECGPDSYGSSFGRIGCDCLPPPR